jgi:glycosyltransferase involved in cell wall biosynthesis
MQISISSTTLLSAMHDGIGNYTKRLIQHYTVQPEITVTPLVFPTFFPTFSRRSTNFALANQATFPYAFETASVFSMLTTKPLLKINADIYHATDYCTPKLNCPVVSTLHDAIPLKHPEWVRSNYRALKNFTLRTTAKWADHVIALSRAAIPDLVEYFGIPENKITVVHCGVDESWLRPLENSNVEATLKKYKLPNNYFLFVGTLQPRKNILRILNAYMALPNRIRQERKLVIVGRSGWYLEDVTLLLTKLQSENEVVWLQNIAEENELRAIYQGAGVFVFPSLYEGFGIPVLEAFASKVPVLTSNTTSLPEVTGDAAVLVNPLSVEEIKDAMQKLAEDNDLRQACIQKGFIRAQNKTWKKCAEETLAVYKKLL